jgi:hypothetical protein
MLTKQERLLKSAKQMRERMREARPADPRDSEKWGRVVLYADKVIAENEVEE